MPWKPLPKRRSCVPDGKQIACKQDNGNAERANKGPRTDPRTGPNKRRTNNAVRTSNMDDTRNMDRTRSKGDTMNMDHTKNKDRTRSKGYRKAEQALREYHIVCFSAPKLPLRQSLPLTGERIQAPQPCSRCRPENGLHCCRYLRCRMTPQEGP